MAILVDESTRVIVQGITGTFGSISARSMINAGTKIVAGVTPGKGGHKVHGIPVYDSVEEAIEAHPEANATITFVPAMFIKDAVIEAIKAKLSLIVIPTEAVPTHDAILMLNYANIIGVNILGPESIGVFSPGKCKLGVHPDLFFREGRIGIVARGGTIVYDVANVIRASNHGISTCVNIGDHKVLGIKFVEVLRMFEKDDETKAIVLIGEIGGRYEEDAAAVIEKEITKPVIALINGRCAPPGKRMGHAGAIIEMGIGTYESKVKALKDAGAYVARNILEIGSYLKSLKI